MLGGGERGAAMAAREAEGGEREREIGGMAEGGDGAEADLGFRDPCMVIWDLESCPLSKEAVHDILPRIKRRLSEWGYTGPVQMLAVGRPRTCAGYKLVDTGILMYYITCGKRSHIAVLCAILSWTEKNRAPANVLLIAGNRYYSANVNSLCKRKYNVLHREQECTCPGRENHFSYCWSWAEIFDGGRPRVNLKPQDIDGASLMGEPASGFVISPYYGWRSQGMLKPRGNDGPLLGEPIEHRDGPDVAASRLVGILKPRDNEGPSLMGESLECRGGPDEVKPRVNDGPSLLGEPVECRGGPDEVKPRVNDVPSPLAEPVECRDVAASSLVISPCWPSLFGEPIE